jgi:ribonuclease Z
MKYVKISVIIGLLIAAGLYLYKDAIVIKLATHMIDTNLSSDITTELEDGLHIYLCGAGSPMYDRKRSGPCTAIIAGKRVFIVDAGNSSSKNLSLGRVPIANIEGVFLTHFHSDHIDGLGELIMQRWVTSGASSSLPVYGPVGVETVVAGFNQAYQHDDAYRIAHHGEIILPPQGSDAVANVLEVGNNNGDGVVYKSNGLKIRAFEVDHHPVAPALGYRFDYKGRSLVISGDTVKSATVAQFAQHVDVLLHEALSKDLVMLINQRANVLGQQSIAAISKDIIDYHTTPIEAAQIAQEAMVGHLVLHHIVPPLPIKPLETIFLKGVNEVYSGVVTIGKDGTFISLPAQSEEINVNELLW